MRSKSFFVNLWITLRCNYRCRYCYMKPYNRNSDVDIDTADKIIDFIKKEITPEQKLILNFHGGEPTLNFEVIKYLVKRIKNEFVNKYQFGITTNGSILDDNMIKFLADNFTYNLSVSIDGKQSTQELNRKSRNCNIEYSKLINNAEKLLAANKRTRIRLTFDRLNIAELYENIKFFIDKGFKYIVPTADLFADNWTNEDFNAVQDQLALVKVYALENNVHIYAVDECFDCLSRCNGGNDHYSIDPDGNIFPCTFLIGKTELIIGDVQNGIVQEKLDKINDILDKEVDECKECDMFGKCISTRCLFTNYATTGDYYKPNLVECNMLNIKVILCESITVRKIEIKEGTAVSEEVHT